MKKTNDKSEKEMNNKVNSVKEILNNVYEILILFKPIIEQMKNSDEFQKFYEDGTVKKASYLFGKISEQSKEIANFNLPKTFLNNLKN